MPVAIRSAVAGLPSYVPGRPTAVGQAYKLSSNENPFPPLPGVLAAVADACGRMNRYPDLSNAEMAEAVAGRLRVAADQLSFGTGSVAVLYQLLQATCEAGDEVLYAWRSFEAYPIAVQLTGARGVPVPLGPGAVHDLAAMLAAVTPRTRAVLLCTPNNPTGPALRHDAVAGFLAGVPDDVLVVIDEAYVEFVTDEAAVRSLDLLERHENVVVLRTFSKAYGLAGFRAGYGVCAPALAGAIRAVSLPFGLSVAAQAAVVASLAAERELRARVQTLIDRRSKLVAGLRAAGHEIPDAQGNFVWLPAGAATVEWERRFGAAGVVVRGFPGDGIRITVGEPEANEIVLGLAPTLRH